MSDTEATINFVALILRLHTQIDVFARGTHRRFRSRRLLAGEVQNPTGRFVSSSMLLIFFIDYLTTDSPRSISLERKIFGLIMIADSR